MKKNLTRHQQLGKFGEQYACSFLTSKGYSILERNYSIRYGEIDIIALYGNRVVYVEVKTRSNESFGLPEEAVTPRKIRELVKTAAWYRKTHPELPIAEQIDVIALLADENNTITYCKHISNVTG